MLLGGQQCIVTLCGRTFPLMIHKGLPYLPQRLPTLEEMNGGLPQCIMTSDKEWDPSIVDTKCTIQELLQSLPVERGDEMYDERGMIVTHTLVNKANHDLINDSYDSFKTRFLCDIGNVYQAPTIGSIIVNQGILSNASNIGFSKAQHIIDPPTDNTNNNSGEPVDPVGISPTDGIY